MASQLMQRTHACSALNTEVAVNASVNVEAHKSHLLNLEAKERPRSGGKAIADAEKVQIPGHSLRVCEVGIRC